MPETPRVYTTQIKFDASQHKWLGTIDHGDGRYFTWGRSVSEVKKSLRDIVMLFEEFPEEPVFKHHVVNDVEDVEDEG